MYYKVQRHEKAIIYPKKSVIQSDKIYVFGIDLLKSTLKSHTITM